MNFVYGPRQARLAKFLRSAEAHLVMLALKLDDSVLTGEKDDFHTRAGQGPGRGEKLLEETGNRSRESPVVMRTNE